MHILLRDLAIHEAKEKNFFTIFSKGEEYDNQLAERKPRRAALQFCPPSGDDVYLDNTRSLLCFGFGEYSSNDGGFRLLNYSCFRLLRALTIEHVDMRNSSGLVGLIHLRYLGFRYCTIRQELFVKISLYNLETIDLKGSCIEGETTYWSDVVIPNLRHIYGYKKLEHTFPLKWDHHSNLQTLKSVGQGQVHSLECCTNLRTLGISYTKDNEMTWCPLTEWQTLKGVLKRTKKLVSLSIEVTLGGGCLVPFVSTEDLPCHEKIQSLRLCGKWGTGQQYPSVEMFPTNLTKLTMEKSRLREDPMPIFERLQCLKTLRLGPYSYEGTELICSTGGFPMLKKLELKVLPRLRHWDIKEGAMLVLSHLKIDQCDELHALPELQKVQTLQELLLNRPLGELQGKDRYKIEHIPSVRITTDIRAQPAFSEQNPHLNFRRTETSLHANDSGGVIFEADKCKITKQLPVRPSTPSDVDDLKVVDLEADKCEIIKQPSLWPTNCSEVEDLEIAGLEADKCNIINQLLDRKISGRMVFSIVGTGGLGKTTLAKKLYKSAKLEEQFNCRIWLSISKKYNLYDLWREILYSVEPRKKYENPPITGDDLLVNLKSSMRYRRYFIILDDVWDIDLWKQLKKGLPDQEFSRVIITSRSLDVALAADCNSQPYELCRLNNDDGIALLFRKAFQKHIQPKNYPPDLLRVAKRLIKKCGGLPLALVVLGGILTRRDRTYSAWCKVEENMDWSNEDEEKCMKILARSYDDLPYHLKPCFLYFAAFPEDYKISGEHVTRMWMAEGLVSKNGAGTIEDSAEKCLEELVQRCLIQVTKKSWNGYIKCCSMHDLLRDLAIEKAKEENFFTIFSKEDDVNQLAVIKPRRAALQFCTLKEDGVYSEKTRSLICFGFGVISSNDSGFQLLNYSGFRLLRVLTLEHIDMEKFAPGQWLKGLIHLKYLGLRNCSVPNEIFKKISFYNLETLDLTRSEIYPREETSDWSGIIIPTLRHVYGLYSIPCKWNKHPNLVTVKSVSIPIELVVEFGFCTKLRTLVICLRIDKGIDNERALKEWQNIKGVLRRTEQLVNLSIYIQQINSFLPFGGTKDLPCHEKIQKLNLFGKWERNICIPTVDMFPTNLTKLVLQFSKLEEDPMPILERLRSLRILKLDDLSYMGTELICSSGGFSNLEILRLAFLPNLHHWDLKQGAMPILKNLFINQCYKLDALPKPQNLQTLRELLVSFPSYELDEWIRGLKAHIASIRIRRSKEEEDEYEMDEEDEDEEEDKYEEPDEMSQTSEKRLHERMQVEDIA